MSSIQLHSGRLFNLVWVDPESFTIEDIAQGLMNQQRFSGHGLIDYDVAQHCIAGARWFRKRGMLLEAQYYLLHEGEEGLGFCDLPTPLKYLPQMEPYRTLGKNVQFAVFRKFGLLGTPPKAVKELDTRMAAAEAKILCRNTPSWALAIDTSDIILRPYKDKQTSKKMFLKEFDILFKEWKLKTTP